MCSTPPARNDGGQVCAFAASVYDRFMQDQTSRALAAKDVLYEDNHLLVVNKAAGLLTQAAQSGDDCLLERAREYVRVRYNKPGKAFMGLVHRLDRNVSGVVVLARTSKAASRLSQAFAKRLVDKRYLALVVGRAADSAELRDVLAPKAQGRGVERSREGKEALLRYTCIARSGGVSLLEVVLMTGRKHQIRAQLAFSGLPLVGDPLYGTASRSLRRPALHASWLSLEHPVRKESCSFHAPLPLALKSHLQSLGISPDVKLF